VRQIEVPILLDSWLVFPKILRRRNAPKQNWNFEVLDDQIVLSTRQKRDLTGSLTFVMRWPAQAPAQSFGLLKLVHSAWNALPFQIVCTKIPTSNPDDHDWRLMCPIRRTWNQVLLLDPEDMLFVSREMVGRKRSGPIVRRALQFYFKALKLEEEYSDLLEKPQRLSEADYTVLKQASDFLWDNFVLAAGGVPDINQIQKAFMKQYFPSGMDFQEGS
jgi:hypothetical protein